MFSTNGRTIRRLQVGMHPNVAAVAKRVLMIPRTSCDAALASRMLRDVNQAVNSELFCTHAPREHPSPRLSSFLYFFLLVIYSHQLLFNFWRLTFTPYPWAYKNHTSIRRLCLR